MLEIFFPKTCSFCTSLTDKPLCMNCTEDLYLMDKVDCCAKCGEPFGHIEKSAEGNELCLRCIKDEFYFDFARSVFFHKGFIKELVHKLKYRKKIILAQALSELLILNFPFSAFDFDTVIPVPLHKSKLRKREYNQSSLLAKKVAGYFNCNFDPFNLVKINKSKPQFEMGNLLQRIKNVRNLFEARSNKNIEGKNILLIDDVYTTGSTINECSKVLLKAGAAKIGALTLTRATF